MIDHNSDVIISVMASQIVGVSIVCWSVGSGADQRKHQSYASLAFVRGIHRWPVNSPHKGLVTQKTFPFDDVIVYYDCPLHNEISYTGKTSLYWIRNLIILWGQTPLGVVNSLTTLVPEEATGLWPHMAGERSGIWGAGRVKMGDIFLDGWCMVRGSWLLVLDSILHFKPVMLMAPGAIETWALIQYKYVILPV